MDLKLFVDLLQMERNGFDSYTQLSGSRLVAMAFDEESEKAEFVRSKLIILGFRRTDLAKNGENAPSNFRRHWSPALDGFT